MEPYRTAIMVFVVFVVACFFFMLMACLIKDNIHKLKKLTKKKPTAGYIYAGSADRINRLRRIAEEFNIPWPTEGSFDRPGFSAYFAPSDSPRQVCPICMSPNSPPQANIVEIQFRGERIAWYCKTCNARWPSAIYHVGKQCVTCGEEFTTIIETPKTFDNLTDANNANGSVSGSRLQAMCPNCNHRFDIVKVEQKC